MEAVTCAIDGNGAHEGRQKLHSGDSTRAYQRAHGFVPARAFQEKTVDINAVLGSEM